MTITSIIRQLDYLIDLTTDSSSDPSRLGEIVVGVQAAREIESLDLRLAELLYDVDEQAREMARQHRA